MSSVLYYLRSESEQPPFYDASREADDHAGRFPDRSTAKRTVRTDATFRGRHTISIATQQRTNETIVRAARIYFIKIYSSIFIKNTINYQTFNRFTSRSQRTRRNPGVFSSPCRATEHTIDQGIRPGHAKCVRFCPSGRVLRRACNRYSPHSMPIATVPRPNQDSDRAGRIPMKFLSYGHVLSGLRRTCRGNDHRETAEREIRT